MPATCCNLLEGVKFVAIASDVGQTHKVEDLARGEGTTCNDDLPGEAYATSSDDEVGGWP
jgi:hypothetical protein